MLTTIAKNAIIIISLSLIFIPAQIYASTVEKLIETLHSRPQQKDAPTIDDTQDNAIIIQPETLSPTIVQPSTPANDLKSPNNQIISPEITIIQDQNVTTPTAPTVIMPNNPSQPTLTPLKPVIPDAVKEDKTNKFIPLTPMPLDKGLQKNKEPKAEPQVISPSFSLTDFLIQTDQDAQSKLIDKNEPATPAKEKPTEKVSPPKKTNPAEKVNPPAKEIKKEKISPPKPAKPAKPEEKKKGDPLVIPDEAKKSGNLDFLEGCWVGYRPEYHTKRMVTERFCFDAKGVGKRHIIDPQLAGKCIGSTKALINKDGLLLMDSEEMYCTPSGKRWGGSKMQCQGEGKKTPCTWNFSDLSGATQSYEINFVRE